MTEAKRVTDWNDESCLRQLDGFSLLLFIQSSWRAAWHMDQDRVRRACKAALKMVIC